MMALELRLDSRTAMYCHELLHKKHAPNSFPNLEPDAPNEVFEEFKRLGFVHEREVLVLLKEANSGFHKIEDSENKQLLEEQTFEALFNDQITLIAGAYIGAIFEEKVAQKLGQPIKFSNRVSRPDLLVKINTLQSEIPVWAPVDIKSHKAIEASKSNFIFTSSIHHILPNQDSKSEGRLVYDDLYQLAHYTRHLQFLNLAGDDLWVGIIGRQQEEFVWSRIGDVVMGRGASQKDFLSDYDKKFAKAAEVIALSIAENENPSKKSDVIPVNSTGKMGCTVCSYKQTCLSEMEAYDNGHGHVTLLAGVTPLTVENHFPQVSSINELASSTPLNDAMIQAQIRARVWQTGTPELLDPSEPFEIPEADIEIDIDLENSMEALRELEIDEPIGEDRLYLYGFGIHDRTKDLDWHSADIDTYSDYSNTADGEFSVMSKMWNKLNFEIEHAEAAGQSIKIFHYSPHEFTWWKRFVSRYGGRSGVPTLDEMELFKINYLVDLYPIAKKISFKSKSYSIKDLAPLAKFEWKVDKAGGANSLFQYKKAIDKNLSDAERQAAIDWLDSYNRDDVRATFAVRNYLRQLEL